MSFSRALAIVVAILVASSFAGAILNGWYFGACDGTVARCEVKHVWGVTMHCDNTSSTGIEE